MTDNITRLKEALEAGPTTHAVVYRAMALASTLAGNVAMSDVMASEDASATLKSHLLDALQKRDAAIRELLERLEQAEKGRDEAVGRAVFAESDAASMRLLAEQAEKDARRYRWLRTQSHDWGVCEWDTSSSEWVRDARGATVIDAAIDAAIASQEGGQENG